MPLLRALIFLALHAAAGVAADVAVGGGVTDAELRDVVDALRMELESQQQMLTSQNERIDQLSFMDFSEQDPPYRKLQVAQEIQLLAELSTAMDHMWLLICGSLVMFMQAGFAMVEAGCCRAKNVQNILMKNLSDACIGTLGWWSLGWALAYGHNDGFFGIGFNKDVEGGGIAPADGNLALNWFFQWAFCSAAATIVSGGVAERVRFGGYAIYSLAMTGFIYPIVVSWTWGGGWLSSDVNDVNFIDFAGSGVVHLAGGTGALIGSVIAGARHGRWEYPEDFVPHSLPLVVLGTFILWFGWYGFNCGSTLSMHDAQTGMLAAQIAMNTTISAAVAGLTVFVIRLATWRKYDVGGLCNGVLAGLVSITAGCGNVELGSACVIGCLGGIFYQLASALLRRLKIDDPIDAFPVHGVCGAWGLMAAALFDWGRAFDHVHAWSGWDCMRSQQTNECLRGVGGQLVAANAVTLVVIVGWVGVLSSVLFAGLRLAGLLRATDDSQELGMDSSCAIRSAYTFEDAGGGAADADPSQKKKMTNSDFIPIF